MQTLSMADIAQGQFSVADMVGSDGWGMTNYRQPPTTN